MTSFNDTWKNPNDIIRLTYSSDTTYKHVESGTFKTGRKRYITTFNNGYDLFKHESMELIDKFTGNPYFVVNVKQIIEKYEEPEIKYDIPRIEYTPKTYKSFDEILQMYNRKITVYKILRNTTHLIEDYAILIIDGEKMCLHMESYYKINKKSDKPVYYTEQDNVKDIYIDYTSKDMPVIGGIFNGKCYLQQKEFTFLPIDVLNRYYIAYEKKIKQYMKTQFLEDLVKVICHPSRIHTFEALGFYEDDE
jgi:hypothetical protein